jgi:peptidoglycan/LPS O-acetylase OafA/YrhL
MSESLNSKQHFLLLDGLRGLAAVVVVFGHTAGHLGGFRLFPGFAMAVDFFFVLSGFVIGKAYEGRLAAGAMSFANFFSVRMIRLYPMVFAGAVLGFFVWTGYALVEGRFAEVPNVLLSLPFALLVLPSHFMAAFAGSRLFPLDGPVWSLFFELAANFAYALLILRGGRRLLVPATLLCAGYFLFVAFQLKSTTFGNDWTDIPSGFARVGYPFLAGILAYRLYRQGVFNFLRHAPYWLVVLAVVAALMCDSFKIGVVCVLALFPLLVLAGAQVSYPKVLDKPFALLGAASYPVYVLHMPVVFVCSEIAKRLPHERFLALAVATLISGALIVLSTALLKVYDEPVRRWLTGKLRKPAPMQPERLAAE